MGMTMADMVLWIGLCAVVITIVGFGAWFWYDEFGPGHYKHYKEYYDWMDFKLKEKNNKWRR